MSETATFAESLIAALDQSAAYASDSESPPAAILWPDKGRQWTAIARLVAAQRPLLTLGEYDPPSWTGPAVWVRCVVDGSVPRPAPEGTPIVYLPGYDRAQVRTVEEAPVELRPLLELQHRGAIFAQLSNRDWTLAAFLGAAPARGGLGIEVGADKATKAALRNAAGVLAAWRVGDLRRKAPLRADFFNSLLVPDLDRDVLEWLNDPAAFAASRSEAKQQAFREAFRSRFGLDLIDAGELTVAQHLGKRQSDAWTLVWQAFADAPDKYPHVEDRLRAARPKGASKEAKPGTPISLFDARDGWPQDNEAEESNLRAALLTLATAAPDAARARLIDLEYEHRDRRRWVWARLGRSPLAFALEYLAILARHTQKKLPSGTVSDITEAYTADGWLADDAVMRALAAVEAATDVDAVGTAILSVYREWLEVGAERLQQAIGPGGSDYLVRPMDEWPEGTAVIFTDGLRYDVGRRLGEALRNAGMAVEVESRLTTIPTITPSGKPGASPAFKALVGGADLGPTAAPGGPSLSADGLRKRITEAGYQVLGHGDTGTAAGCAWTEQGDIDSLGHDETRLAPLLDSEVHKLELRVGQLLAAGWAQVAVVTDHGWLYLPGGLPKAELPVGKVKEGLRKGRAARLADGVEVDVPVFPWTWDADVRIASAPGIRSFVGSPVYEHGGVSPQECITPVVIARAGTVLAGPVELAVSWIRLRARVTADGAPEEATVDLRRKAGDPASSVLGGGRPIDIDGAATFLVEDDDLEGTGAFVVILDPKGTTLAMRKVTIGEND